MNQSKFIPIVLCAGFGTRLKPITNIIPKVVCPIIDRPLAFFSIENFFKAGFEKVYCNTHYLPDFVENELKACAKYFGYNSEKIVFFREAEILGSGGGILNIVQNLCSHDNENKLKDVIISSGDVVADFPLDLMIKIWEKKQHNELALMLSLPLAEDREDILCVSQDGKQVLGFGKSFLESADKELNIQERMFSNHQIISKDLFNHCELKPQSSVEMFYKKILLDKDKKIIHHNYPEQSYWFNVGDIAEYEKCLKYFCKTKNLKYPPKNKMHHFDQENHSQKSILQEYGLDLMII